MFKRLVLKAVALVALALTAYSLYLVDQIVQSTLPSYGLQFNYDWANPYWTLLKVTWALLGICAVAITVNTIFIIRPSIKEKQRAIKISPTQKVTTSINVTTHAKEKAPIVSTESQSQLPAKPSANPTPITTPESSNSISESSTQLFKCTHCGKAFTQPLRMLDFHVEPPRIVNVCPFCSETISSEPKIKESEHAEKRPFFRKNNAYDQKPFTQ